VLFLFFFFFIVLEADSPNSRVLTLLRVPHWLQCIYLYWSGLCLSICALPDGRFWVDEGIQKAFMFVCTDSIKQQGWTELTALIPWEMEVLLSSFQPRGVQSSPQAQ
jgi:hypothetical protein